MFTPPLATLLEWTSPFQSRRPLLTPARLAGVLVIPFLLADWEGATPPTAHVMFLPFAGLPRTRELCPSLEYHPLPTGVRGGGGRVVPRGLPSVISRGEPLLAPTVDSSRVPVCEGRCFSHTSSRSSSHVVARCPRGALLLPSFHHLRRSERKEISVWHRHAVPVLAVSAPSVPLIRRENHPIPPAVAPCMYVSVAVCSSSTPMSTPL